MRARWACAVPREKEDMSSLFVHDGRQRRLRWGMTAVLVWCLGLLAFGLYLQHVEGLVPCPMCIVQRYALILVAVLAGLAVVLARGVGGRIGGALAVLMAVGGAATAARQSWLQWYPPEILACGRDFFGMVEAFPLQRAIPMIFKGSGDCSAIDWTWLGLSIANWSFLNFCALTVVMVTLVWPPRRVAPTAF